MIGEAISTACSNNFQCYQEFFRKLYFLSHVLYLERRAKHKGKCVCVLKIPTVYYRLYTVDLEDLLEITPKKDVLFIIGDWNAKLGHQETPGVKIWTTE